MTELEEVIRSEIRSGGAMSFARFMALALYHPQHGYYRRHSSQTGRNGDFYTSVNVGSLYGELLGFHFANRLRTLPGNALRLIEAGAHDGQLALDILNYLREYQRDVFRRIHYVIIEPSEGLAQVQFATLANYAGKVSWVKSWAEISEFDGICFSNELLDAMPVHVFRWDVSAHRWTEWGVSENGGHFSWSPLPAPAENPGARKLLARLPAELTAVLPDLFTIEISPEAVSWWLQAAHALRHGAIITVDYGFLQDEFFSPQRARGTLRAYSRHHSSSNPLGSVGDQDITAHVNFSLLIAAGESAELRTTDFSQQGVFLKSILEQVESAPQHFPLWTPMRLRQLTSLIHPEHLGRSFKVLVQVRE